MYDLVEPWAYRANREAGWGFDLERTQSLQFGVYPVGGHYDWHLDQTGRPYDARDSVHANFHGLLRKVSFSVELSDPDSYEGGVLEMEVGLPGDHGPRAGGRRGAPAGDHDRLPVVHRAPRHAGHPRHPLQPRRVNMRPPVAMRAHAR